MKFVFLIILPLLFSCSDSYELQIEPESVRKQKYRLSFNGQVSFPDGLTKKDINLDDDRFEVTKIKFIPIKKWDAVNSSDNVWGQAGLRVRIVRKDGIFTNTNVIFEAWVHHFFNPGIDNLTAEREAEIRSYNDDLDSGLGDGTKKNDPNWENLASSTRLFLESKSVNFYHSLINKVDAGKALAGYKAGNKRYIAINENNVRDLAAGSASSLIFSNLSRCTIIFPYDSLRMMELRNF